MRNLKKIFVTFVICFICLIVCSFSYAAEEQDNSEDNNDNNHFMTQEEAGQVIATFTKNFYDDWKTKVQYSNDTSSTAFKESYQMILDNGTYKMNSKSFIDYVIHNCLGLGEDEYQSGAGLINRTFGDLPDECYDSNGNVIRSKLKPGDVLYFRGLTEDYYIYIGKNYDDSDEGEEEIIYVDSSGLNKSKMDDVINFNNVTYFFRIRESVASSIRKGNARSNVDVEYEDEYGRYYGTTEGRYVGSYSFLSWLFNAFVGFMDYLFGIICYILRAPFIGWANIVENIIDSSIVDIQGLKVQETTSQNNDEERTSAISMEVTEASETIEQRDETSVYKPVANDKFKSEDEFSNRVNIENIIYNELPILDVDIFDVNLTKYENLTDEERESTPVKLLRENIAIWYFSIRNVTIVIMLLFLVYLGIRLAVSVSGEKKAQYKELLKAWVVGFIVIFTIHYFMILVIEVNNTLVGLMKEKLETQMEESGTSESLYDTVRTRAYSFKLSEGVPATIIYMVLIYFLIRFLFIYVKRYFTVNILTLMGPVIGAKYAFDKIQKGKTTSLSSWMFDYALNVLLQSVHAMLYTIYMTLAFQISSTSIPGFILALIMINFIFKAENIFLHVFKFNERASSIRDVRENKNYFAEAYAVTRGIGYYAKAIPLYGFDLVKNTTKLAGNELLAGAQLVTSGVNRGIWIGKNINAKANGEEPVEYKPIDVSEKLKKGAQKVSAGVTGKLDDALYKITGARSLKLGLGRMKLKDPEQYAKIKSILDANKKKKRQVLKRNISSGIKSVTTMAKLMGSIPMIVVDPGSGVTMLSTTVGDLKDMASGKPIYGHASRKQIRGKRGRVIATMLLGTPVIAINNSRKMHNEFKNDRKEIRKNEEMLADLRLAQVLKSTITTEAILLEAQSDVDLENMNESERKEAEKEHEELVKETIKASIASVLVGKDIQRTIKRYMKRNNITTLQASDIENILREFNIDCIQLQIDSLNIDHKDEIEELQNKVDSLKDKIKDAASDPAITQDEIDKLNEEVSKNEENVFVLSVLDLNKKAIKDVGKKVSKSGNLNNYMIHKNKLEHIVKDYIKKNKITKLEEDDIDKMAKIFEIETQKEENTYTDKESIEKKFEEPKKHKENKKQKKMNYKESTNAVLDSVLENGDKGIKENLNPKKVKAKYPKVSNEMISQIEIVSNLVRELETLDQKNKVKFGKSDSAINANRFIKEMHFGDKKKSKGKK